MEAVLRAAEAFLEAGRCEASVRGFCLNPVTGAVHELISSPSRPPPPKLWEAMASAEANETARGSDHPGPHPGANHAVPHDASDGALSTDTCGLNTDMDTEISIAHGAGAVSPAASAVLVPAWKKSDNQDRRVSTAEDVDTAAGGVCLDGSGDGGDGGTPSDGGPASSRDAAGDEAAARAGSATAVPNDERSAWSRPLAAETACRTTTAAAFSALDEATADVRPPPPSLAPVLDEATRACLGLDRREVCVVGCSVMRSGAVLRTMAFGHPPLRPDAILRCASVM